MPPVLSSRGGLHSQLAGSFHHENSSLSSTSSSWVLTARLSPELMSQQQSSVEGGDCGSNSKPLGWSYHAQDEENNNIERHFEQLQPALLVVDDDDSMPLTLPPLPPRPTASLLDEYGDDYEEETPTTTWQEEAHWMSFRHAVLAVAAQQQARTRRRGNTTTNTRQQQSRSAPRETARLPRQQLKESGEFRPRDPQGGAATSRGSSDTASPPPAGAGAGSSVGDDSLEHLVADLALASPPLTTNSINSGDVAFSPGLVSSHQQQRLLSETQRQLAMAQAERDAMEVELLLNKSINRKG